MILADYSCPNCDLFELAVPSPAPDSIACPTCGSESSWSPSPIFGKVNPVSVSRGGWQKPEHPGWLDTRELGEGQPIEEFRARRRKIREEQRRKELKDL